MIKQKNSLHLLAITLLVLAITFSTTNLFGQQRLESFNYNGKNLNYTIQLPLDFDATKTYPVLVGPSKAESVDDESFYWKGTKDSQGWILIGYRIYGATNRVDEIKALLNYLKSTYKVEGNKFHTVCFSANSSGIFDLVMQMPDYFSGITGMAGNPNTNNKEKLKQLKDVKVQFIVGDKDTYWMSSAKKSHQILLDLGVKSSVEIIKNGQHVMKPLIGKGFLERANRLRD